MAEVNIINIDLIKTYQSDFEAEKSNFDTLAFQQFNSSYINTCSDNYVSQMASKLSKLYGEIANGYKNINNWWVLYNNNVETLEAALSSENRIESTLEGNINSHLQQLPVLEDYYLTVPEFDSGESISFNLAYTDKLGTYATEFSTNSVDEDAPPIEFKTDFIEPPLRAIKADSGVGVKSVIISAQDLLNIINNEETFIKFTKNFEANRDIFPFSQTEYANGIIKLLTEARKSNYDLGLDDESLSRIKIIEKYSYTTEDYVRDLKFFYQLNYYDYIKLYDIKADNVDPMVIFSDDFREFLDPELLEYAYQTKDSFLVEIISQVNEYKNSLIKKIIAQNVNIGDENVHLLFNYIFDYNNFGPLLSDQVNDLYEYSTKMGYNLDYLDAVKLQTMRNFYLIVIPNLENTYGEYIPNIRGRLEGTLALLDSEDFENLGMGKHTVAFNDGEKSVLNIEYDYEFILETMYHESLHQLSCNDGIQGLISEDVIDSPFSLIGLNEIVTELLTLYCVNNEYLSSNYSGYGPATDRLNDLINLGVIDLSTLAYAYFNNDILFLKEQIESFSPLLNFEELNRMFAFGHSCNDPESEAALNELDELINHLVIESVEKGENKYEQ